MPNTNSNTLCLHVPKLICGTISKLNWEPVDGAVSYNLEACFDTNFGDASSTGKSWLSIENSDKSWQQIETLLSDWQSVETTPESHAVFKGTGTTTKSPDAGLTWIEIKDLYETWIVIDTRFSQWIDIDSQYTSGRSWDSFDANHKDFDLLGTEDSTWTEIEGVGSHSSSHLYCDVTIPINARRAIFRLRAYDQTGNVLASLTTEQVPVLVPQYIKIVPSDEPATIQIDGENISAESMVKYELKYDPALLDGVLQKNKRQADLEPEEELWDGTTAAGQVVSNTNRTATLEFDWYKTN